MEGKIDDHEKQTCPYCGKKFERLSSHAPKCKTKPGNEAGITSVSCDRGNADGKSKLKLNKKTTSPLTSAAKYDVKESSTVDSINVEDSIGSTYVNSAGIPVTQKDNEKAKETCSYCGMSFKCLAKHIKFCKMHSNKMDAEDIIESRRKRDEKDEAEKEQTSMSGTNDRDNGSRGLKLKDPKLYPRSHMDSKTTIDQGKTKTTCPYCGRGFDRLKTHLNACKKKHNHPSLPISCNGTDTHSDTIKPAQPTNTQSKFSIQNEEISETLESEECLPSLVRKKSAEGNRRHQNETKNINNLKPHKIRLTPLPTEPSSLANIRYSEDPKAELVKFQACNEIDESEICAANEVVEKMRMCFLQRLNECDDFKWKIYPTGSYTDKTKIQSADEFDFIICIDIKCRAECLEEPDKLGYCLVVPDFEKNVHRNIKPLMTDNYLDPRLVKDMAFKLFDRVIKDHGFRKGRQMKRLYRGPECPAFTFNYDSGGGKRYDIDLVPAIHFDGWPQISAIKDVQPKWWPRNRQEQIKKDYFAVARKNPNAEKVHQGELLWRLSFTNTEKMLWLNVDSYSLQPTCRRQILKNLKGILEICKSENATAMPNLSTFHLRTFMLHQFDQRPDDKEWLLNNLRTCLQVCIDNLIDMLKQKNMNNYYVQGHNVLKTLEDIEIQTFVNALTNARTKF